MRQLISAAAIWLAVIPAHAAITGIVQSGPGGSNLEVQFSSAGAFKGVPGSHVDGTAVTLPGRVNAASFSGAVLPAGVDLSTVTTRFVLVGAATGQLRIDADKVAVATTAFAAAGYVDTAKIATDAVTAIKILNNTITAAKFSAGAVDTAALGTDSVTAAKILNGVITAAKFATGAVDTAALSSDAVTTAKIINGAVDTAKHATDSITTAKIINAAVDTSKLASDAVTAVKILNGTITASKFASGSVDTSALASDAVTTVKLINSAVDTAKHAADSVTTAKLINAAVDTTKLAADSVSNAKILNAAVDTNKLATDSVSNAKILNAAVDTNKIATDAITGAKILNGTISAAKLNFSAGTGNVTNSGATDWTGAAWTFSSRSSCTIIPSNTFTNTDYTVIAAAAPGSTITYTNTSSTLTVTLSGACSASGVTNCTTGILVDGAFVLGEVNTGLGLGAGTVPSNTYQVNVGFSRKLTLAAGSHTYTVIRAVNSGGTGTFPGANTTGEFCVREDH